MVEYSPHITSPSVPEVLPLTLNKYVTSASSPDNVVRNPNINLMLGDDVVSSLLYDIWYTVLGGPLNEAGGIHVSDTDVVVIDVTLNDWGIEGAEKDMQRHTL